MVANLTCFYFQLSTYALTLYRKELKERGSDKATIVGKYIIFTYLAVDMHIDVSL